MSAGKRRARALELLHMRLNALRKLTDITTGEISRVHLHGDASDADINLYGVDVSSLVAILATRRWSLDTPEAITMARILQEIAPRSPEGV